MADLIIETEDSLVEGPAILIVDDQDESQSSLVDTLTRRGFRTFALHPEVVEADDIRRVDLILVDYDLSDWDERDAAPPGRRPRTGISLLAILRDHLLTESDRPVGFAINTARFHDLPTYLPRPVTRHALARANNFEWVFDKTREDDIKRICHLAEACHTLPNDWVDVDALGKLEELLALPDESWLEAARRDVMRCRPPVHELSRATDGLALIRWLLQRILPYPCFLYGHERLAVRLGVTTGELTSLFVSEESSLVDVLTPARYAGILEQFDGTRWWAAGVEAILWDLTEGNSFDRQHVRDLVESITQVKIESITPNYAILAIDEDYEFIDHPVEIADAVRIQPDDWPPYADDAWTKRPTFDSSVQLQRLSPDEGI